MTEAESKVWKQIQSLFELSLEKFARAGTNEFLYDCLRAVNSQQTRGRFLPLRMRHEDGNTLSRPRAQPLDVLVPSHCSLLRSLLPTLFATSFSRSA